MNIVQQLLNSNVQTGGTSSRFKFVSRSPRFSAGSSDSSTNFSKELRRQLSTSSSRNAISFGSEKDRFSALRDEEANQNFARKIREEGGFSSSDSSRKEFGLQVRSEPADQTRSNRDNSSSSPTRNPFAAEDSSTGTSSESVDFGSSAEKNSSGLSKEARELLNKLEKGEIDLSDEKEVGRLKKLLESVTREEANPKKTRAVMKSLQELFSEPSKILQQLQGQSTEELKSSVEGLKSLLESFKKVATESREQTRSAISEQVKSVLRELGLSESNGESKSAGEQKLSESSFTVEVENTASSEKSSKSTASDSESSPTKTLKKTLGKVIEGLEKLSQKLSGKGSISSSFGPGEAVEKIKSFLESIKKSLNGSGNSSENGSGKRFLSRQVQQVMDEIDRTIQDEDLRKKIKSKLEKMGGSTDGKNSPAGKENDAKSSSGSKESKSSESGQKSTANSDKSSSGEKNANKESSKSSKPTSSSTEASQKQSDQSSTQKSGDAKAVQDASKTEQATRSGEGSEDAQERTAKSSQSGEVSSKEQKKGDQKGLKGSDSKSSSAQSKNSNGPTPTAEAVKEKASESSKQTNKNTSTSKGKAGSDTGGKNNSKQGAKAKTAAVKNQPDKAESSSKPSGQTKQSSESSKLKTSEQSFKTTEKQVQQAAQSKDVVVDKGDANRDDVRTKNASNSRTDKLASFETNSARAVDASEESGTSFSNGGNSNGNSGNLSANVKSQVTSYTQRSPEARQMINQIVERAQTMLEDGKQSMRMQLQPESLGEVKLEVSIEANKVSARFKVENSSVKQTLNGSMEQLKQSLHQMGLDVDGVEVSDMSAEEGGNDEQWFDEQGGDGRGRGGAGDGEDVEEGVTDESQHRRRLREYSTIELVA